MVQYTIDDLIKDFNHAAQNYATRLDKNATIDIPEPLPEQDVWFCNITSKDPHTLDAGHIYLQLAIWYLQTPEKPTMYVQRTFQMDSGHTEPVTLTEQELQLISELRALRRTYWAGR